MVSFDSLTHLEDLEKICFSYKKLLWVQISCNDYLSIFLCWMASYPKYWHQLMKENDLHFHFPAFLFQSSSIYTGKSQDITSTINKDHYVPADVKRPFEIVNGNRFGVLCQSLLDIAYDSSCWIKAGDIIPDPTTISRCASRRYAKSINFWFYWIFLVT